MSFLQPLMLAALPLVSLPLIIHLINQRRFQTVPWAAMMFLMTAKALSRGSPSAGRCRGAGWRSPAAPAPTSPS